MGWVIGLAVVVVLVVLLRIGNAKGRRFLFDAAIGRHDLAMLQQVLATRKVSYTEVEQAISLKHADTLDTIFQHGRFSSTPGPIPASADKEIVAAQAAYDLALERSLTARWAEGVDVSLKWGAQVDRVMSSGQTPLQTAVAAGFPDAVSALLRKEANPLEPSGAGQQSPFQMAQELARTTPGDADRQRIAEILSPESTARLRAEGANKRAVQQIENMKTAGFFAPEPKDVKKTFEESISADPNWSVSRLNYARFLYSQKEYDAAGKQLEQAKALAKRGSDRSQDAQVLKDALLLEGGLQAHGTCERGAEMLAAIAAAHGHHPDAYAGKADADKTFEDWRKEGDSWILQADFKRALHCFEQADRIKPGDRQIAQYIEMVRRKLADG